MKSGPPLSLTVYADAGAEFSGRFHVATNPETVALRASRSARARAWSPEQRRAFALGASRGLRAGFKVYRSVMSGNFTETED